MIDIEKLVSPLIQEQFPEFYQEEGPRFVDFIRQYYIWLESQNQALNISRSLFNYRDIDSTLPEFLTHFRSKYLQGMPLSATANVAFLTKHALDLYKSKGTLAGLQLFFRGLYDEDVNVYLPSEDLFKTSDGIWYRPVYLELTQSTATKDYVGFEIIGNLSGAKAFAEGLVTRKLGQSFVDVLYLSNVRGNFQTSEFITLTSNQAVLNAPQITGSMTTLSIVAGGAEFAVGDVFNVTSSISGKQGKARITSISNQTGKVFFEYANTLVSGGWGYSTSHSQTLVAHKMLGISSKTNANTQITDYALFETVSQQLANISFTTARPYANSISVGDVIINFSNTTGAEAANAAVVAINASNTTAGYIVVAPNSGNVAGQSVFAIKGTGASSTFNALTGVANTTETITTTASHSFVNGDIVVYKVLTGNTAVTGLSTGAAYYVVNTVSTTSLKLSDTSGGAAINVTAGASETGHLLIKSKGSAVISAYTDRTSTANLMGSNTQYVGVVNVAGQGFLATPYANLVGLISNTTGTVANIGTGSGANLSIGLLTDTETVFLAPDRLYLLNSNNTYFVTNSSASINLNGNNSGSALQYGSPQALTGGGFAYGGFGFAKFTASNVDSTLLDALRFDSTVIGSIATITGLNPGANYNLDPFVKIVDTYVSSYSFHDYVMGITPVSGLLIYGEQVQQSTNSAAVILTVNTFSGTAANGTSMTTVIQDELIYQSNNTTNVVASGFVMEIGLSAGAGTIKLRNVTGTFANTTSANTKMKSKSTGGVANISLVSTTTFATEARGFIKQIANSTTLYLKRINLFNTFTPGSTIVGQTSGATATISYVDPELATLPIGLNANIGANVQVANNVATGIEITDSGFSYGDYEQVTLSKEDSSFVITAIVRLGKQGEGSGFYRTNRGFSSSTSKIQDNYYYQTYSYEVQTGIPFDQYQDVLKKVMHVAGSKAFGKVLITTTANVQVSANTTVVIS